MKNEILVGEWYTGWYGLAIHIYIYIYIIPLWKGNMYDPFQQKVYVGFDHYLSTKPTLSTFMTFHFPCYPSVAENFHITSQAFWTFQKLPMCLCICPRWKEIPIPHLFIWKCWKKSCRTFGNSEGLSNRRQKPENPHTIQLTKHRGDICMWQPNVRVPFRYSCWGPNHCEPHHVMVLQTNHAQNFHHNYIKQIRGKGAKFVVARTKTRNHIEMEEGAWTHEFLQMNVTRMYNK